MTTPTLDQERLACAPMGALEYVVECRQHGRVDKWYVLRPHRAMAATYYEEGVPLSNGCRIVVDANSMRTIGVLGRDAPPPFGSVRTGMPEIQFSAVDDPAQGFVAQMDTKLAVSTAD